MKIRVKHKYISRELQTLSHTYLKVKEVVLLAENLVPENAIVATSINELRNALDHIFKCYLENSSPDHNIDKAKGHILRAGFDAYELIALSLYEKIEILLKNYTSHMISIVLPNYFTEILPTINEIQMDLSLIRSRKSSQLDNTEIFNKY